MSEVESGNSNSVPVVPEVIAEDTSAVAQCGNDCGLRPGVSYPLKVQYCGECSLPLEYCDYSGKPDKCRQWREKNLPDLIGNLQLADNKMSGDEKKHQKRGGKGSTKSEKLEKEKNQAKITVQRAPRGKTKSVTVIKGLSTVGIDLKVASKFFASRFACGSSVTGADEIVIQGDVKDELFDVIPEKWKNVDEDVIEDLGDQKR